MAASVAATFVLCSVVSAEPVIGEKIYQKCVNCHGENAHGKQFKGDKRAWAPAIAGLQKEYIARQVRHFRDQVRGSHIEDVPGHRMRPMARMLNDEMIEAVAGYLSTLPVAPVQQTIVDGDIERGKLIYNRAGSCNQCHGDYAEGNLANNGPDLRYTGDWYILGQLKNFKNGYRGDGRTHDDNGRKRGKRIRTKFDKRHIWKSAVDTMGASMVGQVWPKDGTPILRDEQDMKDVVAYITYLAQEAEKKRK